MAKPFILKYKDGEWAPHKRGNNPNQDTKYDEEQPPNEEDLTLRATVKIYEGSQWVNIGGRWYRIG